MSPEKREAILFNFYSAERRSGANPLLANERMSEFAKRLDNQSPFEREQELVAQIMEQSR